MKYRGKHTDRIKCKTCLKHRPESQWFIDYGECRLCVKKRRGKAKRREAHKVEVATNNFHSIAKDFKYKQYYN